MKSPNNAVSSSFVLLGVVGVFLVVFSSCRSPEQVGKGTIAANGPDMGDVLSLQEEGDTDGAVALLLEMVKVDAPSTAFRFSNLTEDAFVRLPESERDQLRAELITEFKKMRVLVREIDRRGRDALTHGDRAQARTLFDALMRFGEANTGPDVTKLANIVGESFVKRAKQGFDAMSSAAG